VEESQRIGARTNLNQPLKWGAKSTNVPGGQTNRIHRKEGREGEEKNVRRKRAFGIVIAVVEKKEGEHIRSS